MTSQKQSKAAEKRKIFNFCAKQRILKSCILAAGQLLKTYPLSAFQTLVCPACREEDETTILEAKTPTPLLAHSPASPDMVAMVMYQKSFLHLPFYRQSKDWLEKGVPVPRETAAHWYNYCSLEYLLPVYEALHQELLSMEVLHADEVPCQVLHEEGKSAASIPEWNRWKIEDVVLVCCLAHCRRKFFEAVPKTRQKKLKLLDINSEQELTEPLKCYTNVVTVVANKI